MGLGGKTGTSGEQEDDVQSISDGKNEGNGNDLDESGKKTVEDTEQEGESGGEHREANAGGALVVVNPSRSKSKGDSREDKKDHTDYSVTKGSHFLKIKIQL